MMAAEPQRRMRLLHGLGLHGGIVDGEELALHRYARLRPQPLHEREPFLEACGTALRSEAVCRVHARVAAEAHAGDETAAAELVDRCKTFRKMDRVTERGEENGGPQAHALCEPGRVREEIDRLEAGHSAQDLLDHPRAMEPERFRAAEKAVDSQQVDRTLAKRLRNGDSERNPAVHGGMVAPRLRMCKPMKYVWTLAAVALI